MDIKLREIASKPAGTYFIVTDNSVISEVADVANLRVVPINVESGITNVLVVFQQGDTASLHAVFGKSSRKKERQGNFSIRTIEKLLTTGPVGVINLRKFEDDLDQIQIATVSANKSLTETQTVPYSSVFNKNGFWVPKASNIPELGTVPNLLNFANVGNGNLSFFVTYSKSADSLTNNGDQTLYETDLEVEDYPALNPEMLVKDTFVDVWIFNNSFNPANVSTNQYYGHLFGATGLVNYGDLETLSQIPQSGFNRKITGSFLPYLKNEFDEDVSIDTLLNTIYSETGLICYINDELLEMEEFEDGPVLDIFGELNYRDATTDIDEVSPINLSYRLQNVTETHTLNSTPTSIKDTSNYKQLINSTSAINMVMEPKPEDIVDNQSNKIQGVFEQGLRAGDTLYFSNTETDGLAEGLVPVKITTVQNVGIEVYNVETIAGGTATLAGTKSGDNLTLTLDLTIVAADYAPKGTSIPAENLTVDVLRKLDTDTDFIKVGEMAFLNFDVNGVPQFDSFTETDLTDNTYHYAVNIKSDNYSNEYTKNYVVVPVASDEIDTITNTDFVTPVNDIKTKNYTKVIYTLNTSINNITEGWNFIKVNVPIENLNGIKLLPTNISGYTAREAQFTNGSPTRQSEILDILNTKSMLKGFRNVNVKYVVDAFKSFVEAGYKYQFGQLMYDLDNCNIFARAFVNEPFIEDLENSTNPLFKDAPNGNFSLTYLNTGGNPDYSTETLSKFTTGAEMCYFYGQHEFEKGRVSNLILPDIVNIYMTKTYPWDVVANTTGVLGSVNAVEVIPDDDERKAMENFRWNPIIKNRESFVIYGNFTGQKKRSALQEINNSELLAYIKRELLFISLDENFKRGTYNEYLSLQTEVETFMNNLALSGAIQPNPIVNVIQANTEEVQKLKIKLVHVEYFNIGVMDKVVFDLKLN